MQCTPFGICLGAPHGIASVGCWTGTGWLLEGPVDAVQDLPRIGHAVFGKVCHTKQAILLEEGRPQNTTVLQSVRVRRASSDSRHLDSWQRCERLACYQMLLPTMLQSVRVKRASNGSRYLESWQRCEASACYQMSSPTMLQSVRVRRASSGSRHLECWQRSERLACY